MGEGPLLVKKTRQKGPKGGGLVHRDQETVKDVGTFPESEDAGIKPYQALVLSMPRMCIF